MKQNPGKDNISSTSQGTLCILLNPKVLYGAHYGPVLLNHINPTHAIPNDFFKISFNIILPPGCRFSEWPLSFCYQ